MLSRGSIGSTANEPTEDNVVQFPGIGNSRPREWKQNSRRTKQFFAIDAEIVSSFDYSENVLDILTYIVLASGAQGGHRTTSWSATSVSTRLNVRWKRVDEAIGRLIESGRIERISTENGRPRYRMSGDRKGGMIWLPNALVEGAASETPPVKVLHQIGDIRSAIFFLKCYEHLDMAGCGGVDIDVAALKYDSHIVIRHKGLRIYRFDRQPSFLPLVETLGFGEEARQIVLPLVDVGLLMWVTHLRTGGEDGASLGACDLTNGQVEERERASRMDATAREILMREHSIQLDAPVAVVPSHIEGLTMVGVLRPRYLPMTSPVERWLATMRAEMAFPHERYENWAS